MLPPSHCHASNLRSLGSAVVSSGVARRGDILVARWRGRARAVIPFTLIVIVPTNKQLLTPTLDKKTISRNLFRSFWNEWFEQQFERRTQPQLFTFILKQFLWIGRGLQRVPEVRQPHEPQGMARSSSLRT